MEGLHILHSSIPQGDGEARNKPYRKYGEVSTGTVNAAVCRKSPARLAAPDGRVTVREL